MKTVSPDMAQDRLHGYPTFLKNLLVIFTVASVLAYDREMRCVRTGFETIVDSLRHLLIEKSRGSTSGRTNPSSGKGKNGSKSPGKGKKNPKKTKRGVLVSFKRRY